MSLPNPTPSLIFYSGLPAFQQNISLRDTDTLLVLVPVCHHRVSIIDIAKYVPSTGFGTGGVRLTVRSNPSEALIQRCANRTKSRVTARTTGIDD